jgi:hypothetical protein
MQVESLCTDRLAMAFAFLVAHSYEWRMPASYIFSSITLTVAAAMRECKARRENQEYTHYIHLRSNERHMFVDRPNFLNKSNNDVATVFDMTSLGLRLLRIMYSHSV